jgi:hypothetical protein
MADDVTALLSGIRERWSKVAYVGLRPEVVPEPGDQPPPWLPDVPHLLAAVEALSTALQRHREWFTDSKGVMLCGGCLKPVPCPDDPDAIVEQALSGKDSADGETL